MGNLFSNLFSALWGGRERRVLVLGLDNAGKTTILYQLQAGEVVQTVPTMGFNMETRTVPPLRLRHSHLLRLALI